MGRIIASFGDDRTRLASPHHISSCVWQMNETAAINSLEQWQKRSTATMKSLPVPHHCLDSSHHCFHFVVYQNDERALWKQFVRSTIDRSHHSVDLAIFIPDTRRKFLRTYKDIILPLVNLLHRTTENLQQISMARASRHWWYRFTPNSVLCSPSFGRTSARRPIFW